jgi:hypothetical protein
VLVRGALRGAKWDSLRESWSRANIAASHPDVTVQVSSIPYAKGFGLVEHETFLTLEEYMTQVMDPAAEQLPDALLPRYIFTKTKTQLPANSSIHAKFLVPDFLVDVWCSPFWVECCADGVLCWFPLLPPQRSH